MVSGESIQYQIRPSFEERFKKAEIEEMVRNLIVEKLDNVEYDVKVSATLTKELAKEIQDCLQVRIQSEFRLILFLKISSVYKLF